MNVVDNKLTPDEKDFSENVPIFCSAEVGATKSKSGLVHELLHQRSYLSTYTLVLLSSDHLECVTQLGHEHHQA